MMRLYLVPICALACALSDSAMARSACPFGTEALCVPSMDTICPYGGKCVSQDAICFKKTACDFDGFACKSDLKKANENAGFWENQFNIMRRSCSSDERPALQECQAKYENLTAACKSLVEGFTNQLKQSGDKKSPNYEALLVQDELDKLKSCIHSAGDLESAKNCAKK